MTITWPSKNEQLIGRARQVTAAERYDLDGRPRTVAAAASGAWMVDEDGRRLLDLTSGNGTTMLGHRHPAVIEAVCRQLRTVGPLLPGTLSRVRIELAERICARFPVAEKVSFFRSGSEATTAAVRLARAATGRPLVLSCGYHGWHDWQLDHDRPHVDAAHRVVHFRHRVDELRALLEALAPQVACVIVSPDIAASTLDDVRAMSALSARHRVPFVLDEVMSGLRYGPAGVHGAGVTADIVVISKGLASGHALAAVLGPAALLDYYDRAQLGGTYNREISPMAAALATLRVMDDQPVHERCTVEGTRLRDRLADVLATSGFVGSVGPHPTMFRVTFEDPGVPAAFARSSEAVGLWSDPAGRVLVNAAFGEVESEFAAQAFALALSALSHTAAAPVQPHRAPVDIKAVLDEAVRLWSDPAASRGRDAGLEPAVCVEL